MIYARKMAAFGRCRRNHFSALILAHQRLASIFGKSNNAHGLLLCSSISSNGSKSHKQNNGAIQLSASPINNYKTTQTFGDRNKQQKSTVKPIVIGCGMMSVLMYIVFFLEGEPLDLFSTEVFEQLELKFSEKLQVNSTTNQIDEH